MPTYEYICNDCGHRLEVFQKFTDKPLRSHPGCGGELKKVFHASGVVFKGSGYYVTDSRPKGNGAPANSKPSNGSTGGDGSKSDKSTKKAEKSESAAAAD